MVYILQRTHYLLEKKDVKINICKSVQMEGTEVGMIQSGDY